MDYDTKYTEGKNDEHKINEKNVICNYNTTRHFWSLNTNLGFGVEISLMGNDTGRGWASVLNTHWSNGRTSSSLNNK
jgi:hypothetical protein